MEPSKAVVELQHRVQALEHELGRALRDLRDLHSLPPEVQDEFLRERGHFLRMAAVTATWNQVADLDGETLLLVEHLSYRMSMLTFWLMDRRLDHHTVHALKDVNRDIGALARILSDRPSTREWADADADFGARPQPAPELVTEPPPVVAASVAPDESRSDRQPRYANAALLSATRQRLDPGVSLQAGQNVVLVLDIGPLSPQSQVRTRAAFPDGRLPPNIDLDVMVSSTDFKLRRPFRSFDKAPVLHGTFFLPGDGGPARTRFGRRSLSFHLRAGPTPATARCRIGYYYRSVLVQSQLLTAHVCERGGFAFDTDYTISTDLTNLDRLPERPRISVLTNSNGAGTHQIVVRGLDPASAKPTGDTAAIDGAALEDPIRAIRKALADRAPATRQRDRDALEEDLRRLATPGWVLYSKLPALYPTLFAPLYQDPDRFVVQVTRPRSSNFVIPWSLIYDIPITVERPAVCPLVRNWDGRKPLIASPRDPCPHGPHSENVLCPLGFWGFRFAVEQLTSTDDTVTTIPMRGDSEMVAAQTQANVDLKALSSHIATLQATLQKAYPLAKVRDGKDKKSTHALLGRDLPLVYFYCHGRKRNDADPNTWLEVGNGEALPALEFIGWIRSWQIERKRIWDVVRPLIFVNACHAVAIYPDTLVSYLEAFVSAARAAGVVGPETRVDQQLAAKVAERFYELLIVDSQTVESALRQIRFEFLASGNLIGLAYTPYCWSELRVVRH